MPQIYLIKGSYLLLLEVEVQENCKIILCHVASGTAAMHVATFRDVLTC